MSALSILLALLLLCTSGAASGTDPATGNDCLSCHEQAITRNPESPHFKAPQRCESCHGDGSRHAETGDPKLIRGFSGKPAAEVCVTCHDDQHITEWKASRHREVGVDCADCHATHVVKDAKTSCQNCH